MAKENAPNPFVFGKVVRGADFCNRKKEMQKIWEIVHSRNNLILLSPRRYGKTSLILYALHKKSIPFIFIDCYDVTEEKILLERLASAYLERLKKGDLVEKAKHLSRIINLEYSLTVKGITIKINQYDASSLESIIKEIAKDYILVFDEFQELFSYQPPLVKRLRSILQMINQSFIFLGSKKHLLLYLFSNQKSPFYNFGLLFPLEKIPAEEWLPFITAKFRSRGITIEKEEIIEIFNYSELIPFYVQYLCYHLLEERKKQEGIKTVEVVNKMLLSNSYVYEELYSKLPPTQKKALRIILQKGGTGLFSEETRQEFNLISLQSLNKALGGLEEKGIIEKNGQYRFNDPFFKQYLLRKEA